MTSTRCCAVLRYVAFVIAAALAFVLAGCTDTGSAQTGVVQTGVTQAGVTQAGVTQTPKPAGPGTAGVVGLETTSQSPGPPRTTTPSRAASAPSHETTPPALPSVGVLGVNEVSCRSASRPVVLLHGTFSNIASNFSALVPALLAAHRCVFGLDYGNGGTASVLESADQFAALVTTVRRVTGAARVDVVAYSQGGLVLRTGLRLVGLADQVATAALIAPSWNGTTSPLAGALPAGVCAACADQVAGSPLLRRLDIGGDLDGAVRYAEISTSGDTVVTPISSQVPSGPPDRVRAVVVEDRCPHLVTDHVRLPAVPGVIEWVVSALATGGRPSSTVLAC